jgi:NSS family neurotransmitter:Na+ symporter
MMSRQETFSSRWGLIVAGLGMAIGTGNMWRFPRIVAQNGGAAFLIPWFIFLFSWSLPLLIAEFAIGRSARRGVVGAFADLIGRRYAWMGGFIAVTSVMILFYYSVVTGWTLKYVLASLGGQLDGPGAEQYWVNYSASVWQPLGFHAVSVLIGAAIISRGVVAGIERANRVLIPLLLGLLVVAVARSVTLPGAGRGLRFLFNPDLSLLWSYRTWLEALTQSAWSTGAGWGLILTYAIYMRPDEDVVVNATAIGLGNNTASVLAGMAVVPTAFAILSQSDALDAMASGNTGLTFIWIPQLFARIPGGTVVLPLFFLALFCAALSSLIAMIELATRVLMDGGMTRRRAVRWVVAATIVGGAPSAVSVTIFENQDWVWGLALMLSGLFVALGATRFGARRFREELVNVGGNDIALGRGYEWVLTYLIPVEFAAMFGWWMYQTVAVIDPAGWWSPFRTYSLATCLLQWGLALTLLVAFNRRIAAASLRP